MRSVRLPLVFAAVLAAAAMSEAQPGTAGATSVPLAVVVLNGIDDPVVVAELKLKDEQLKPLVARRTELWDEAYVTAPQKLAETAAARTAATDALLKKTLTEEQYKRATQLGAQSVLRNRAFGPTPDAEPTLRLISVSTVLLDRYPELVPALKITDEQQKAGAGKSPVLGFGRSIVLSKEQIEAAKEFVGPIAKSWRPKVDPRQAAAPAQPAGLSYLEAKAVRAELKLADEETKAFAALNAKWQKLATARRTELSPKEADAQAAVLRTESEKALAALAPAAALRLKQIGFQASVPTSNFGGGPPRSVVRSPLDLHIDSLSTHATVVKEVAVSEEQAKEFRAIREAFEKDAAAVLATAADAATAQKKIDDLAAARRKKAEAVLTAEQAAKLTELVGKPFTGSTTPDRFGRPGGFDPPTGPALDLAAARAAQFGKYTTEVALLATNRSVQEELKLTPEQIKQALETQAEILSKHRIAVPREGDAERYTKAYTERSKVVEEALGKLLTEEQAKRFRQILLQYREHRSDTLSYAATAAVRSAVGYPGVAEAVKVTEEQKQKLLAGTAPADVLTADQKSAIKEMLGAPFKGDFTLAGFLTDNPFASTPANARRYVTFGNHTTELNELADNKSVQDELKLSPEQIKKATELRDEVAKITLPRLGSLTVEEYAKANAERSRSVGEAVAKVLDKDQARRFREIMMRFRESARPVFTGGGWVASAVSYPGAAEAVKLTDDQRVKLITGAAPADVLTADQKSALAKMLGEPFEGPLLSPSPAGTAGVGPGRFPRAATLALIRLVSFSSDQQKVAEALKLTPEQAKKFDAAYGAYQTAIDAIPPVTGPGQTAERLQPRTEAGENFEKAVQDLLTAEQKKRLEQLVHQAEAAQNLFAALTAPETAKQLDLTQEQTERLRGLNVEAARLQNLRSVHLPSAPRNSDLSLRMRDAADERMMAVLTGDQKKKWKELVGDPLPGLTKVPPFASPFAGGFGPGGP